MPLTNSAWLPVNKLLLFNFTFNNNKSLTSYPPKSVYLRVYIIYSK